MVRSNYQRQLRGASSAPAKGRGSGQSEGSKAKYENSSRRNTPADRQRQRDEGDVIDTKFGYGRYVEGPPRLGWLLNYLPTTIPDESGMEKSGLDLYFIDRSGENFKASLVYSPYFYIDAEEKHTIELMQHLQKRFENCRVELVCLEDLDMPNHLSGKQHQFIKISFGTVSELVECKNLLRPYINSVIKFNRSNTNMVDISNVDSERQNSVVASDPLAYITDMRENDVPYAIRCGIDLNLRVGAWFVVSPIDGTQLCSVEWQKDFLELGEPRILAFDIECEKSPLKFPNSETDRIFMISYMSNQQGYLIVNREVVSEDIQDFEYTPNSKFPGLFQVMNVENEQQLLKRFIQHVQMLRPHVIVTYNGDFFDWPYVDHRCAKFGISLYKELGIRGSGSTIANDNEYIGRCMVHLDAFCWVKRDSYLPQGNQGLKAVTRCKLGYDPVEIDPEDMLRFAKERPDYMASYSVSDAVATYYLYNIYVHNFIFSLSTIIPMGPEDVLRKGSGTLCEALLMVEAFRGNIVCPNKDIDPPEAYYNGHLLESETYIGGHVECLEAGIFRADIANKFTLVPSALQMLIDHIDRDLTFALEIENGIQRSDVSNYDEIKQEIVSALEMLRDSPVREEMPLIYHLDVGAMYPNIILTNRLQPSAIVNQNVCASCEFNQLENNCKRNMTWTWRGDYNPASLSEYNAIKRQLAYEKVGERQFSELSEKEQLSLSKVRLKQYSQRVYNKTKVTTTEERVHTVCMRENSFYVDTVRAFRDRRYEYKLLTKQWKGKRVAAEKSGDAVAKKIAESKEVLMDSLQVAHKCILNSFYGYVMRKGARWRSMEMAGIVTHTGAQLITQARILVEQVGRPLELDTDGIWCILPSSFPQDFKFKTKSGSTVHIEYPCAMLNADVHDRYTNHQYQDLNKNSNSNGPHYSTHSECSIFFELDGPYKAMVLPASPEEGVLLKKKYVVFNFDNSIAELKGFELKRRGELELVKAFQSQVFDQFLNGTTLQECYDSVGKVGNLWLDVLDSQGANMDDTELLELISERKTISKTLSEYEGRKATSLTTAQRLSDFLGAEMVKDRGLNCNLIVAKYPSGAPVTDRAIPVAIFQAEPAIKAFFLRKWLQNSTIECDDFRNIVDWDYYKDRLGKTIQKIITIPAGMQKVPNPCPRVEHPLWVKRILQETISKRKQATISSLFGPPLIAPRTVDNSVADIEDFGSRRTDIPIGVIHLKKRALIEENSDHEVEEKDSDLVQEALTPSNSDKMKPEPMLIMKPETFESFVEWLDDRKNEWKNLRLMRRREKLQGNGARVTARQYGLTTREIMFGTSAGPEDVDSRKKRVGIEDLVKNAARAVSQGFWQIVELQETDSPGVFIAWSFTGMSQLQKLFINIPRIIYVNCRGGRAETTAKELGGRLVKKDLPHGRPVYNLYEIHLQEHKYIKNERALGLFLCDPLVEGVYETKTPLSFRAILRLGCIANVSKSTTIEGREGLSASSAFKLKDLKFVNVSNQKYLEADSASYRKIFIYHVEDSRRSGAGVLGLFIISESNAVPHGSDQQIFTAKASVWIVQPRGVVERPPMQRIFRRFCSDERNSCKFTTFSVASMNSAVAACNEVLGGYIRERRGPTIVVGQSIMEPRAWRKAIPVLHQFPFVAMPANSKDEKFPPISWQVRICNIMVQRFLLFPQWFDDRLSCSRYAHIPIGNLGRDVNLTMTDVILGRQLEHNRQILWAAPGPLPDIGGAELDLHNILTEIMAAKVINEEGIYRTVSVELEIFGFSIASIMCSGLLDAQGITTVPTTQSTNSLELGSVALPHDAACARAFNLLKASVTKWINDVGVNGDLHADALLMGLYRFLCGSGQTLLYDPALYRIVHLLMTKLFARLINEFKNLGCRIIYADFYRIIIVTNRYDYSTAKEYAEFVIGAVVDRDLFQCLQINIKRMWSQLIWLDPANWSGRPLQSPELTIESDAKESVPDNLDIISAHSSDTEEDMIPSSERNEYDFLDDINNEVEQENNLSFVSEVVVQDPSTEVQTDDDNGIDGSWDISSHLPAAARIYFRHTLDQFLLVYEEQWESLLEDFHLKNRQTKTLSSADYVSCRETIRKYIQEMIRHQLEPELLHTVDILLHQYQSREGNNKESSHHIALNFVKYITKILSLDPSLAEEVSALRRTLLTQLNIKEFNSQAEFEDTSPSYILRDIICSYCNTCKDLDLLRDPTLTGKGQKLKDSAFDHEITHSTDWQCTHCGNSYDVADVEQRLLDDVEKIIASYLIQDFRCPKTNLVSTKVCSPVSDLCLPLKMDIPMKTIHSQLQILREVAILHEFEWLQSEVEMALQLHK